MRTIIVAIQVVRLPEDNAYVVRAYSPHSQGGTKRYSNADYYTDDKDDAIATARLMLGIKSTKLIKLFKVYSMQDLA